jgi:ABC-type multidrug transport system fused ATPase/permease subunit
MVQVKKALMTYIWRIQQSQMIISIVFWSLTLTGIFYQYFAPLFDIYLGVPQENVFLGMLLLLFIVLAGVIVIGFAYDRIFRLWQESSIVNVERNPYSRLLMMPKEILLWKRCQLRILKEVSKDDPEAQKDIEFMDKWFDKLLEDPKIAKQVEETEKTILS